MNIKNMLALALAMLALPASAQSYSQILELVRHGHAMKAAAGRAQAEKEAATTGLTLADPEVELGYQWGDPHQTVPNRVNVNVSQEFDFATLSGNKRRVARETRQVAEGEYNVAEWLALQEARQMLTELTYYNIRVRELSGRERHSHKLVDAYQKALDEGNASALEVNKARMELQTNAHERQSAETERDALLSKLSAICGQDILFADTLYQTPVLPKDFNQWFADFQKRDPQLELAARNLALAQENVRLEKSSALPSFSLGYAGELVRGANYHGATFGVSLPLWSNKNKVKAARAAVTAAEEQRQSETLRLKAEYQEQFIRAHQLARQANENRQMQESYNNYPLLEKALEAGRLSLIEYLTELTYCYDIIDRTQEAERDAALSAALLVMP